MSARALIAIVVLGALAGCAAVPSKDILRSPSTAPTHGWLLDCSLGSLVATSWNQTCEARASTTPGSKTEMWTAVNPTNPGNVVIGSKDLNPASSNYCVWNGLGVTHDGGQHWKDVTIGGKWADRKPGDPTYGYSCNTDPDFQFTKDGALHYGIEIYNAANTGPCNPQPIPCGAEAGYKILLATSTDGGDTWPTMITYQPDLGGVTDYSRMTIDPVSQAILESIGSVGGCHVMVSKDGGKTATFSIADTKDGIPCSSGGGAIAGSPKGVIVIVGAGTVARSTDDGLTWVDSNKAFTYKGVRGFSESKFRVGTGFELAYDLTSGANRGLLYAAYHAADHDEADVFVRSSKDDGKTWSDAVQVNVDTQNTHQWMPNIAVAGDGSLHVFYMDKQFDPEHRLIDVMHAVSMDAGKTWTNQRVSTVSDDGDLGVHQEGQPFFGDYIGAAAVGNDVWAGFPDTSTGAAVIAAAHVHYVP